LLFILNVYQVVEKARKGKSSKYSFLMREAIVMTSPPANQIGSLTILRPENVKANLRFIPSRWEGPGAPASSGWVIYESISFHKALFNYSRALTAFDGFVKPPPPFSSPVKGEDKLLLIASPTT